MEQTVSQLSARLSKIELEYNMAKRKREEGASKAFKALSQITEEDVQMLKSVVPELVVVKGFTEKDLIENFNDEASTLRRVAEELRKYVEHRLAFYEDQL